MARLKLELLFILEFISALGAADEPLSLPFEDSIHAAAHAAMVRLNHLLPASDYFLVALRDDCAQVIIGSNCHETLAGIRSALHVYRRGNTGDWD